MAYDIKELTKEIHQNAERQEFVKTLMSGTIRPELYAIYLYNQLQCYSVLEKYGNGKIENTPHSKYRDFKAWLSKKEKDDFFRPVSYVYNNVLFHPSDDILMERNVDSGSGIKDNSKVLNAKSNWATKEDPGLSLSLIHI